MRFLTAALVAAFFMPSPAEAARLCLPHADLQTLLATKYQERRVAVGLATGGGLLEVFATGNGATWTIVVTSPQGVSCVVASGAPWHSVTPTEPEGPEA